MNSLSRTPTKQAIFSIRRAPETLVSSRKDFFVCKSGWIVNSDSQNVSFWFRDFAIGTCYHHSLDRRGRYLNTSSQSQDWKRSRLKTTEGSSKRAVLLKYSSRPGDTDKFFLSLCKCCGFIKEYISFLLVSERETAHYFNYTRNLI